MAAASSTFWDCPNKTGWLLHALVGGDTEDTFISQNQDLQILMPLEKNLRNHVLTSGFFRST